MKMNTNTIDSELYCCISCWSPRKPECVCSDNYWGGGGGGNNLGVFCIGYNELLLPTI